MLFNQNKYLLPLLLLVNIILPMAAAENSALALLDREIIFSLNFDDGTLYPEMSLGEVEPANVSGNPIFVAGRFGQALLLGGENGVRVHYRAWKNIDFSMPGAMSFWLAPEQWLQPGEVDERPYLRFFHLQGTGAGYIFMQRQGFVNKTRTDGSISKRGDMFQVGYYSFSKWKNRLLGAYNTINWPKDEWRFFVVNWDRNSASLSINGKTCAQIQFARPIVNEDFPKPENPKFNFVIGNGTSQETTKLDELIIYRRNLAPEEIGQIYQETIVTEHK
ncbi:MAG: LamG-like jellyroll fold domain-containing protein [Lentisphaeria bacterium]